MTIAASAPRLGPIGRAIRAFEQRSEDLWFDVAGGLAAGGARVLARATWAKTPEAPLVLMLHGLTGSVESHYMTSLGSKLHAAGFHVVRLNARNCGGTQGSSATLYHGALSEDPTEVLAQLHAGGRVGLTYLLGVSMGGSIALRLCALLDRSAAYAPRAVVTISAPLQFAASSRLLHASRFGRFLTRRFLGEFESLLHRREPLWPGSGGNLTALKGIETLWQFDERFTAPLGGFPSVEAYYESASPWTWLERLSTPGLLIHALDDPVVDPTAYRAPELLEHPTLRSWVTPNGGHTAFLGRLPAGCDPDRRWAENRALDFLWARARADGAALPDRGSPWPGSS